MEKNKKATYQKMVFGAAITYAAFWIAPLLPFSTHISLLISGAIAIFAVEIIARETGFLII